MKHKLTIAGGSTPYTIELIDNLRDIFGERSGVELAIHGRNERSLDAVTKYASSQLMSKGWIVNAYTDLADAVKSAHIIVHQIRYGDLALRKAGEKFCQRHQCLADETLGPAALLTALCFGNPLFDTCETIKRYAPEASVINLTNPLSVSTSLMYRYGVRCVVGVCELPKVTADSIANLLNIQPRDLQWCYTGLNHRGFLHSLFKDEIDILPELLAALQGRSFGSVSWEKIQALKSVPTKYFSLFSDSKRAVTVNGSSRADYLIRLRADILNELYECPKARPAGLDCRNLSWYPEAVVPILLGLMDGDNNRTILNVVDSTTGITHEVKSCMSDHSVNSKPLYTGLSEVDEWLRRFYEHETCILSGLSDDPTLDWTEECFALDPTVNFRPNVMAKDFQNYYIEWRTQLTI